MPTSGPTCRRPDRSYDWPDNTHIYDFQDITDRLPLPGSSAHPDGVDMPPMDTLGAPGSPRPRTSSPNE